MSKIVLDYPLSKRDVVRWRQPFIWPYLIGFIGCLLLLSASGLLMGYHHSPIDWVFWLGVGLAPLAAAGNGILWFLGFTFGDQLPEKRRVQFTEDGRIEAEGEYYAGRSVSISFECAGFIEKGDHYYFYSARRKRDGIFVPKSFVSSELLQWVEAMNLKR